MNLGHAGRKSVKYAARPIQAKWGKDAQMLWDMRDKKVRGVRDSAELDENGTTGPGELGTFGTKSSDGPEKNRLR
ncbi:hypothetical protein KI387_031164, partial [Taxus chinensis]